MVPFGGEGVDRMSTSEPTSFTCPLAVPAIMNLRLGSVWPMSEQK